MNRTIEFYSLFFDLNNMYSKINSTFKDHPNYIEYICKFIKRLMEDEMETKMITGYINSVLVSAEDEPLGCT